MDRYHSVNFAILNSKKMESYSMCCLIEADTEKIFRMAVENSVAS
jgi:hypothetical protein